MVFFGNFLFTKKESYSCRSTKFPIPRPQAASPIPRRRQPPPTKAALRAALARFDNRHSISAPTPTLTASAAAAQAVQAIPRTDNDPHRTNSAKPAPPILHNPQRAKGPLDRRSKWFSLVTFFLQKKKVTRAGARNAPSRARRRNSPRQGKANSPPRRRNSPNPAEENAPTVAEASGRGSLRAGECRHSPFDRQ